MLLEGRVGVSTATGFSGILNMSSTGLRLAADMRAASRSLQVTLEDGTGTTLVTNTYDAQSLPNETLDTRLMITATQDDGTGNYRLAVYVNGGLLGSVLTGASGATPSFQSTQTYRLLQSSTSFEVARCAIWTEYSASGAVPTATPLVELTGDAAYWNGTGLPSGWSKSGADSFTDV
jgi:hypothetical protein